MGKEIFSCFENGELAAPGGSVAVSARPWNAHKDFDGVFLKSIVTPEHTAGLFTCLLVRIEPGKKIGLHSHPDSVELHEVIAGTGTCLTGYGEIPYAPGRLAILPEKSPHEVRAGKDGLCLFAKFITVRK